MGDLVGPVVVERGTTTVGPLWYIYSYKGIFNHMATRVGIVGHRGYSGAELVRILQHHSGVEPVLIEHRDDGTATAPIRNHKTPPSIPCTADAVRDAGIKLVFLATPPEVSMDLAGPMLDAGA